MVSVLLLAWAARPLGLTALPVRRGRDGEGERESVAGAGEPPSAASPERPGAVLGGLLGRPIVVRERKGGALGVPPAGSAELDRHAKRRADTHVDKRFSAFVPPSADS
ncbi:hypothetical protein GCM10009095_33450 [Sphingomonas molluscorum]